MKQTKIIIASFTALSASLMSCNAVVETPINPNSNSAAGALSQNGTNGTRKTCEVIRLRARKAAIHKFGIDEMKTRLLKISAGISKDDSQDLARLVQANAGGVAPNVQTQANQMIDEIYNNAIDHAGLKRGIGEDLPEISRTLFVASSSTDMPSADGWVTVAKTSSKADATVGGIGDVLLAPNTDQTRYMVSMMQYTHIEKTNDGKMILESELISLSAYVESQIPAFCKNSPSELNKTQFDTLPGLGVQQK